MRKNRLIFFFVPVFWAVPFFTSCFSTDLDVKDSPQPPEPIEYSETNVQTAGELNGSAGVFIEYGLIDEKRLYGRQLCVQAGRGADHFRHNGIEPEG